MFNIMIIGEKKKGRRRPKKKIENDMCRAVGVYVRDV